MRPASRSATPRLALLAALAVAACATPQEGRVPAAPQEGRVPAGPPGTLSDTLSRSGGVLTPPPTGDTEMAKPTPPTGSAMPVIPPPGTPGGDPRVIPK
jgi:hypothetical protein